MRSLHLRDIRNERPSSLSVHQKEKSDDKTIWKIIHFLRDNSLVCKILGESEAVKQRRYTKREAQRQKEAQEVFKGYKLKYPLKSIIVVWSPRAGSHFNDKESNAKIISQHEAGVRVTFDDRTDKETGALVTDFFLFKDLDDMKFLVPILPREETDPTPSHQQFTIGQELPVKRPDGSIEKVVVEQLLLDGAYIVTKKQFGDYGKKREWYTNEGLNSLIHSA